MNENHLIELEIKISHQEIAIEELQKTVHEQYLMIEKLEKSLKMLTEQMKVGGAAPVGPANEKPPHY